MFGIDSILRELNKHYLVLVEKFYTSALSQRISLDKDSVFSSFRMVNIFQNMECESNPCLN